LSRPRRKREQTPQIDPELEQQMRAIVKEEIARLFAPMVELLGLPATDPNQRFVLNPEAREILKLDHNTLMDRIRSGALIEGIHFQGKGRRRAWRPDRLLQYRATEGDQMQQLKDIAQWQREGFSFDPK
jgi:hypothetical protein